jgi:DNA-binding NarL/FixJ family response regulator
MLVDKSVLLENINTTIRRNSCLSKADPDTNATDNGTIDFTDGTSVSTYGSSSRTFDLLKKLEERVEALEDQNDHLLYFIHFLYKNLPNIQAAEEKKNAALSLDIDGKPYPKLTRREVEVMRLLVKGLCAKEIAKTLFICETTVITHKKNLKEKFHAKNTVELISKSFHVLFNSNDH